MNHKGMEPWGCSTGDGIRSPQGPCTWRGSAWGSDCEVAQSCTTLCDPVDYSPPGSSVHGILQARVLEWVSISFSRVEAAKYQLRDMGKEDTQKEEFWFWFACWGGTKSGNQMRELKGMKNKLYTELNGLDKWWHNQGHSAKSRWLLYTAPHHFVPKCFCTRSEQNTLNFTSWRTDFMWSYPKDYHLMNVLEK